MLAVYACDLQGIMAAARIGDVETWDRMGSWHDGDAALLRNVLAASRAR